ncbi:ABC transporter domain-containing protein (plasmid) [Gloeocapsa sp. PCC 7428]|uniref:ABC transporter ATP-binding protein/permease n=1 Tax=Gloeocapsa sp. PCC 7428 TaxID=1173026 RepID=UPI0002A612B9|nr:ABC transporter ATP-binding protein/permease [Gloeocapsa sp. PCC 7428]AFZ33396.1 ABC transporter domain-containing protein [Gloeocapsa sp. PCC 7428]
MRWFKWQVWQRFWKVACLYWIGSERNGAIALLILLTLLSAGTSGIVVLETLQRGEVVSALVSGNLDRFWQALILFLITVIVTVPSLALKSYIQAKLALYWRRWLTYRFLNQYFAYQNFYHLIYFPAIDNPDQRLSEDINNFTQQSLVFFLIIVDSSLQTVGFAGILWSISPLLMVILISYGLIGTVFTSVVFARVLVPLNFEQLKREADFRYGLLRIRENAEAIAFYHGETQEQNHLQQRFRAVFLNFNHLIRAQFGLMVFQNGYQYLTFLLPFALLAPRIFTGELEVGSVTQSQVAFERLGAIFGIIIMQFDKLSAFAAGIKRLSELKATMTQIEHQNTTTSIETTISTDITIKHLTLITPDTNKLLLHNLSLTVAPGESLLIVGASGVGKTSLLRAIAGLWQYGSGTIARPPRSDLLFLPQRPYLLAGSLRQQLLYPHITAEISDSQLIQVLHLVNLPNLAHQDLDTVLDWSSILSGGEQQRLAFARLMLIQPKYALLDEATSALDAENEERIYQIIRKASFSVISVGHRPSLISYHQQVLQLTNESWKLIPAKDYFEEIIGQGDKENY